MKCGGAKNLRRNAEVNGIGLRFFVISRNSSEWQWHKFVAQIILENLELSEYDGRKVSTG